MQRGAWAGAGTGTGGFLNQSSATYGRANDSEAGPTRRQHLLQALPLPLSLLLPLPRRQWHV